MEQVIVSLDDVIGMEAAEKVLSIREFNRQVPAIRRAYPDVLVIQAVGTWPDRSLELQLATTDEEREQARGTPPAVFAGKQLESLPLQHAALTDPRTVDLSPAEALLAAVLVWHEARDADRNAVVTMTLSDAGNPVGTRVTVEGYLTGCDAFGEEGVAAEFVLTGGTLPPGVGGGVLRCRGPMGGDDGS